MKKITLFACLVLFFIQAKGQDSSPKFTIEVSTDSILMDNYFEVKFTLENAQGGNFEAPDFSNFNVIGGPNTASSMSMMNGQVTQSISYTYYLEPKEIGQFYLQPASIETGSDILETAPLEVLVVPNPDGIKQFPQQREQRRSFFDDFWGDQPGFQFEMPQMPQFHEPRQHPDDVPQKKKRKTKKI